MAENAILRGDLSTLIPEQKYSEIVQGAIQQSAVLQHARRLPNMGTRVASMNVLASLPSAGFINGDTAIKPLTKAAWGEKKIYAEELACIVPIPENVVAWARTSKSSPARCRASSAWSRRSTQRPKRSASWCRCSAARRRPSWTFPR